MDGDDLTLVNEILFFSIFHQDPFIKIQVDEVGLWKMFITKVENQ